MSVTGDPVRNRDLFERIDEKLEDMNEMHNIEVLFWRSTEARMKMRIGLQQWVRRWMADQTKRQGEVRFFDNIPLLMF